MTTTHRFSDLEQANARRRRAVLTWFRPEVLDAPEGWSVSKADASELLECFPPLGLRPDIKLCGYQFRDGDSGNGLVVALPREVAPELFLPDPHAAPDLTAYADVLAAVRGDGSPESYFAASLFRRECGEFGATGHGISWLDQHLLNDDCWDVAGGQVVSHNYEQLSLRRDEWSWLEPPPDDFAPVLEADGPALTLTFYTYYGREDPGITRHVDTFSEGVCRFDPAARVIARPR
jgi:hypothetical protein